MVKQSNCEICILSESWLTSAVSDNYIPIDGYNLMCQDRRDLGKKRGGGLVVYIREDLKATLVPDLCMSAACVKIICLKLDLNYTKPIYIMGVYRPPDQKVTDFVSVFDDRIDSLYVRPYFELNVVGDLNVNQ